jgi:site-specific DNA-methyltransferase (adenine-specific)
LFPTDKKYKIIYADPPWKYGDARNYPTKNNPTGAGGAVKHYEVMSLEELRILPVQSIADEDCALFMWATGPKMDWAVDVIKAWGFRFVTIPFVWIKVKNDYSDVRKDGIGSYTLNNAEYILLGKKGAYWRESTTVKQVGMYPKLKHSEKPKEFREAIVSLLGDVSRIELFARQKVKGWDYWGNEIGENYDICES